MSQDLISALLSMGLSAFGLSITPNLNIERVLGIAGSSALIAWALTQ